jgi:xanthine dehydrogenase accessory factor
MTEDHPHAVDPACALAHGDLPPDDAVGVLVAVFASPVAEYLLHFGREAGYRTVLIEPDERQLTDALRRGPHDVHRDFSPEACGTASDVVVTDHDRPELGDVLAAVVAVPTRWVGVMGSPRHSAPHVGALRQRGVPEHDIARVHRPIGLNIGSRTPAEIAISTLAGLIADRNARPGGFSF